MFSKLRTQASNFNIQNSVNTFKSSGRFQKMNIKYNFFKGRMNAYMNKNKKKIMVIILVFFIISIYFIIFFRRVPRFLARMNKNY